MLALAALSAAAAMPAVSHAQLYWDLNGTGTAGAGTTPTGNWDNISNNWNSDSTGLAGGTLGPWASGNTAFFSAGTDATAAFTVTVPTGTTIAGVAGITVEEGTPTLAGPGTIQLNAGAIVTSATALTV